MERSIPLRAVSAHDDRHLVDRCIAGDRDAQRRLFAREKRRVHATLYRILGPKHPIEHLLEDVFVSAFRSLPTLSGCWSVSAWLDRCAVRAALAHLRRLRGLPHLELVVDRRTFESPLQERSARARKARLFGGLRLPVEVEPWSDTRWARVERETFAQLDQTVCAHRSPGRGRAAWVAAWSLTAALGVMAAILALRAVCLGRSSDPLRVATSESGSQLTVGESSLRVGPRSLLMVGRDEEPGIAVVLDRGAVTFEATPHRDRSAFVVDAGDVRVRGAGARFTVARDAAAVSVAVEHGTVEVRGGGRVTAVRDGQRWPSAT